MVSRGQQDTTTRTDVLAMRSDGGVGFHRRPRPAELERRSGMYDLPALHLWRRLALPHDGGLQAQVQAAAAGAPPQEALQVLGTYLTEGGGVGIRSVLSIERVGLQPCPITRIGRNLWVSRKGRQPRSNRRL